MTTLSTSEEAKHGDELDAASMTQSAERLLDQATDVARKIGRATKQSVIDELLKRHQQLVANAIALNSRAIKLIAGEAKVEGNEIVDLITQANNTLKGIASFKKSLGLLDSLLSFTAAVLTGSGTAIVTAGIKLRADLKAAKKA